MLLPCLPNNKKKKKIIQANLDLANMLKHKEEENEEGRRLYIEKVRSDIYGKDSSNAEIYFLMIMYNYCAL